MKTLIKTAFTAAGLFLCLAVLTVDSKAQCVQCTPAPPGFICTASISGGDACATGAGHACTLTGACIPQNDRSAGGNETSISVCAPKILKNPQVKISDRLIMEMANSDPRLAIALINLRNMRVEFREARVSLAPIDFTIEDVANHLLLSDHSEYFKALKKTAGDLFTNGGIPVLYEFFISDDFATMTVKSGDLSKSFSAVELNLIKVTFGKGKNQSDGFRVSGWQFK